MFEVSIDIRGIPEIARKLDDLSGKIRREVFWEMYRTTVDSIEKKAKELCPRHTGALRNSIITLPVTGFPTRYREGTVIVRAGGVTAPYAQAQEFGFYLTIRQLRAIARKKGGITPYTGLKVPRWIPGKYFMVQAKNYGIPIIIDRLEKKIKELTA